MKALIDSIILYKAACAVVQKKWFLVKDDGYRDVANYNEGRSLQKRLGGDLEFVELDRGFPAACAVLKKLIESILQQTGAADYLIFLSDSHVPTFRHKLARTKVYKGHRPAKPKYLARMIEYAKSKYKCHIATKGREDDDEMGIVQTMALKKGEETIICSTDKDMLQIPGWHYHLDKHKKFFVRREGTIVLIKKQGLKPQVKGTGLKWFYVQLLIGDAADNIPGVPAKYTKVMSDRVTNAERIYEGLSKTKSEDDLLNKVIEVYSSAYPEDWQEQLNERGRLLRILTCDDTKFWDYREVLSGYSD